VLQILISGLGGECLSVVRFQVLTAASMKMSVFWDVVLCNLLEIVRRFRCTSLADGRDVFGVSYPRRFEVTLKIIRRSGK
jgi:hypothetical protein